MPSAARCSGCGSNQRAHLPGGAGDRRQAVVDVADSDAGWGSIKRQENREDTGDCPGEGRRSPHGHGSLRSRSSNAAALGQVTLPPLPRSSIPLQEAIDVLLQQLDVELTGGRIIGLRDRVCCEALALIFGDADPNAALAQDVKHVLPFVQKIWRHDVVDCLSFEWVVASLYDFARMPPVAFKLFDFLSDSDGVVIRVYNALSGEHVASFPAAAHERVAVVKSRVTESTGIPGRQQQLLLDDVVLEDGELLQSYGVPQIGEVSVSLITHGGDLVRIAAAMARNPHRAMLKIVSGPAHGWYREAGHGWYREAGWAPAVGGYYESWRQGWTWAPHLAFSAFSSRQPGTIRIAVGVAANGPRRVMLNHPEGSQEDGDGGKSMTCQGWVEHLEFWAFPTHQAGTIRIAVGVADGPHRVMLNHPDVSQGAWNEGRAMTFQGWQHHLEFWAFPTSESSGASSSSGAA